MKDSAISFIKDVPINDKDGDRRDSLGRVRQMTEGEVIIY